MDRWARGAVAALFLSLPLLVLAALIIVKGILS